MSEAVTTDWVTVLIFVFSWFLLKRAYAMGRKNRKGKNLNHIKINTCEICGGFTENMSKRCGMCLNVIKRAFKNSKVYYDKEEKQ